MKKRKNGLGKISLTPTAKGKKGSGTRSSLMWKTVETLEAIAEDCGDTEPKLYEAIIREAGYHERA